MNGYICFIATLSWAIPLYPNPLVIPIEHIAPEFSHIRLFFGLPLGIVEHHAFGQYRVFIAVTFYVETAFQMIFEPGREIVEGPFVFMPGCIGEIFADPFKGIPEMRFQFIGVPWSLGPITSPACTPSGFT